MPRCRDARRLSADPDHEPNFYCINRIVGAPDVKRPETPESVLHEEVPSLPPMGVAGSNTANDLLTRLVLQAAAASTVVVPPSPPPPPPPPVVVVEPRDNDFVTRLALAALLLQQLAKQQQG